MVPEAVGLPEQCGELVLARSLLVGSVIFRALPRASRALGPRCSPGCRVCRLPAASAWPADARGPLPGIRDPGENLPVPQAQQPIAQRTDPITSSAPPHVLRIGRRSLGGCCKAPASGHSGTGRDVGSCNCSFSHKPGMEEPL